VERRQRGGEGAKDKREEEESLTLFSHPSDVDGVILGECLFALCSSKPCIVVSFFYSFLMVVWERCPSDVQQLKYK
jgi:hypothetical protein